MASFTRRLFTWHAWLGLVAGAFILVFSLTGAALVFNKEIDRSLNQRQRVVAAPRAGQSPLPYDALYARARTYAARRGYTVGAFRELPEHPTETLDVLLVKGEEYQSVFQNPYTGQLLGPQQRELTRWLLELHYTFLLGRTGEVLASVFGLALVGSVLTGLAVYRKHLLPVLLFRQRISWKNWRTAASGLHRVLGVWTWLFNLVLAVSGVYFMLYLLTPAAWQEPEAAAARPAAAVGVSLDAVVRRAQARVPGLRVTYLNFPRTAANTTGQLYGDLPGRWWLGEWATTVTYDARTGVITAVEREDALPVLAQVGPALGVLHFGQYGGLAVKLLYCACGLLTAVISLTGFALWWRRQGQKGSAAARRPARPAPVRHHQPVA